MGAGEEKKVVVVEFPEEFSGRRSITIAETKYINKGYQVHSVNPGTFPKNALDGESPQQ